MSDVLLFSPVLFQQLLIDGANRHPERTAFCWIERERRLSYAEALDGMNRVAGALAGLGVKAGDRVGICAHNGIDYLLALFGTWRLGAVAALVNVQYAATLDYYLKDCQPKVLIYTGDLYEAIERHRPELNGVEHLVCLDEPQEGAESWTDLLANAPAPPPDRTDEGDVAHLSYTSGTSGDAKGVCLAHEPTMRATRCIAERLRVESSDVSFGPTTLSSSYHLVANLLPALHCGAAVCVMSRWEAERGWQATEDHGATIVAANPIVLTDLLVESRRRGRPPRMLRLGLSGGGPVPPELKAAWRDELRITLAESYGQSELGGFVALGSPDSVPNERLLAAGRPLPDKEVRIVDDEGEEVPIGSIGEIVLRGGFMAGYWPRSEKTSEVLRGGWLHTGDVGFMDTDNFIFVRGRLSERLRVAGDYIYPRDIEEMLLRHEAVREAALIGVDDLELGHRPIAYVSPIDGPPDPTGLARWLQDQLGREIRSLSVVVVDAMPMTPTGKIAKARLKDAASSSGAARPSAGSLLS